MLQVPTAACVASNKSADVKRPQADFGFGYEPRPKARQEFSSRKTERTFFTNDDQNSTFN